MSLTGIVLGGSGVLGTLICEQLRQVLGEELWLRVGDRNPQRGAATARQLGGQTTSTRVDAHSDTSLDQALAGVDFALVALNQPEPRIQRACLRRGIPCIDVTAKREFTQQVRQLDSEAQAQKVSLLLGVGFLPGLSGLMVKYFSQNWDAVQSVDLGLLQNGNARVGRSGILDMIGIIAAPVPDIHPPHDLIPGFLKTRSLGFGDLAPQQSVHLINHMEAQELRAFFPDFPVRYWTAWNRPLLNQGFRFLQHLGWLPKLATSPLMISLADQIAQSHQPEQPETAALSVEVQGKIAGEARSRWGTLIVPSDYGITARAAGILTKLVLENPTYGVHLPFECFDWEIVYQAGLGEGVQWMEGEDRLECK
ncbi:saccharopine dehydrogenase NADP-binding domain-containing protein [Spirulina subsalsa FACHB-351]|uniref:Saccharopine dehydrogenase NADP-binding domain-containing protein n=1 Tax=Spirulina subsalsa FACHB-351 TaxID=234711 RepID=A0ABT3L647_9CYAN|nr:saccharopine dehydrogenase NADP-binding domain-containing protein [Spirulina subsalsa]MCW6036974.1 saccharopine dehydrogenase NADP-binding domain-containing protein [Spirulina subsalsa FACHB-351]